MDGWMDGEVMYGFGAALCPLPLLWGLQPVGSTQGDIIVGDALTLRA